jgi:hypothetical protein
LTGQAFTLSHLLDKPGGTVLNPNRKPPVFHPVFRGKDTYFNFESSKIDPRFNDVGYDKPLLEWIGDSGIVAIAADNLAVERSSTLGAAGSPVATV